MFLQINKNDDNLFDFVDTYFVSTICPVETEHTVEAE